MTVGDTTIQGEGLVQFFKNIGKKGFNVSKKLAKKVLKNRGRVLEMEAIVGSAFAYWSPKLALSSLPEVINFYHTGEGFYVGKFD